MSSLGGLQIRERDKKMYICDKCDVNEGHYIVKGAVSELSFYDVLCGSCCGLWLFSKGDVVGAHKFGVGA